MPLRNRDDGLEAHERAPRQRRDPERVARRRVIVGETAAEQTRQCLRNLDAIAHAGGASLADAVRIGVFLVDMGSFAEVNEAYAEFFADDDAPARYAFGVASLPRGALVGFEAVVAVP